jgi:hypothetical protein
MSGHPGTPIFSGSVISGNHFFAAIDFVGWRGSSNVSGQVNNQILGKPDNDFHHPGEEEEQRQSHAQHLGNKHQGHFIDLGGGLEHADQHAGNKTHRKHGGGKKDGRFNGLHKKSGDKFWGHGRLLLQAKLLTNDPTIRCHPSASTKIISLKGRDTIIGGSIIIPMDKRTLATTMSIIKNGT